MRDSYDFFDTIYNEDCIVGLQALPDACVDLVVTDPPFAIDFKAAKPNYNRTESRVLEGYNEVSAAAYPEFSRAWLGQVQRVLKTSGSAFIFSGWNNLKDVLIALDELGFIVVNHIIWKYQFGVVTKRRFVTSHYHCLFVAKDDSERLFYPDSRFTRADRTENNGSARYRDMEDVWVINREYWKDDIKTPTKLPAELIEKILSYTTLEGHVVLDPFLGSGQVAVVAQQMNRKYLGFEIVPAYFEFAKQRLEQKVYRLPSETSDERVKNGPGLF